MMTGNRLLTRWLMPMTLLFALLISGQSRAALDPALQALVDAGDVDGVATQLANAIQQGGENFDADGTLADIARSNPDIAGAVVNATVRSLSSGGQNSSQIGSAIRDLVSGVLTGFNDVVAPGDTALYAENLATNVRQVVAAVSGGNQVVGNNLLADARAGVGQSVAQSGGQAGGAAAILRGDVQTRLAGSVTQAEVESAPQRQPVVVVQVQPQQQQQQQPQPQQQTEPEPVTNQEENPQRDVISPS